MVVGEKSDEVEWVKVAVCWGGESERAGPVLLSTAAGESAGLAWGEASLASLP